VISIYGWLDIRGNEMIGKNRICELMKIRYPIIQSLMNWVSSADLVAAVSKTCRLWTLGPNAGTKTIMSDVLLTGERLRA
jgi:NAD(P)H-dependent flavin oxidoreductase YrpB (nitropropane dioxygenase family)